MLILPILALLCAPALWVIFGKPRFLPTTGAIEHKKITIIIPARDEEENIQVLLESINLQKHAPHEIIVVNDGSTDSTAKVAQKLGATVLNAKPLPQGWKGKPWACQQGATTATGEWLLFLDADTFMASEDFLSRLGYLTVSENHVFSICPWHYIKRPYEQLSAFFNVLMLIGMDAFGADQTSQKDTRLVGQCMLISTPVYEQCDGHETVKNEVLENYKLSTTLKDLGIKRSCIMGKGHLSMRMFSGGFLELWNSWKKGFISGAADVSPKILVYSSVWITSMFIAIGSLITASVRQESVMFVIITCAAYITHATLCLFAFRQVGRFSFLNAFLFPISLTFYHLLFISALISVKQGKKVTWKGRDVS